MRRCVIPIASPLLRFTAVWIAGLLVAAGPISGADRQAAVENPAVENPAGSFRRIPVPVNRPDLWPKGSWQAVPLDEFQRLLKAAGTQKPRLKPAWIDRAVYTATFSGRSLRGGRLSATVRRTSDRNELLILDPLNLPLSHPSWTGRAALWGTTRTGRTVLLVSSRRDTLRARWSLAGRSLPHGVEFDIRVAPASVSRLELRLPDGYQLAASAGVVSKPAAAETGWKQWRVDLGSLSATRITIGRTSEQTVRHPLVLAETDTSYVIRREGTQFQASFNLEIAQAPVKSLRFQVPPELEIDRLTYGGEETLSWRSEQSGPHKIIVVRLPDALRGRSRPLRIDGFTATRLGQDRTLPRIRLQDAVFLSGQSHLRVAAPLELLAFSRTGCRQTGVVASADEGETFTFDDDRGDARLTVRVGLPPLELSARIITQLLATADDRKLMADVEWTARSGSTFSVQCSLPADWHLLDVTAGQSSQGSRVTNWEIARRNSKRQILSIEFLDALAPESPKNVRILARRGPATSGRFTPLPVVRPSGCRSVERLLVISRSATIAIRLLRASLLKPIREADLPEFVRQSALWKQIGGETDSARMLLYANTDSASAVVLFGRADPPIDVDLRTTLELNPDRLTEKQQIDVRPRGTPLSRLFVYLTTSGPPFRWTLQNRPGTVLVPRRIPESRYAAWNLPENPDGELWEIPLPTRQRKAFRLVGTRSRSVASRVLPALAFVPGATKFQGRVDLTATGGIDVDAQIQGLQRQPATSPADRRTGLISMRQSWEYRGPDGALILRFHPDAAKNTSIAPAAVTLRSFISRLRSGEDIHQATFSFGPASYPEPFRFELPPSAILMSVRLNGRTVLPRRSDRRYTLSVLPANRRNTVEIHYRCSVKTTSAGLCTVAVPRSSCAVVAFSWYVALPPGVALAAEPDGVRLDRPLPRPNWNERLFGPLGRPADLLMFSPWSVRSWRNLFDGARGAPSGNQTGIPTDPSFLPADWNIVHGTAARLPDVLTLELHDVARGRLISWLALMGVLIVGLTLRVWRVHSHRVLPAVWFSLCLTTAWLAPVGIVQQLAAGGLAATFLAWILPQSLLPGRRSDGDSTDTIPAGSTVSLPGGAVLMALLAVGCLFVQVVAKEPSRADQTGTHFGGASAAVSTAVKKTSRTVLIPVGPDRKPLADLPVVYLTKPDLAQLRAAAARRGTTPEYLISSAEYRATIDAHHFVTVEARYHVVTLAAPDESVRLSLRLADGNPADCLVNGRPQPLFRAPDGSGIVVELQVPPAEEPVVAPRPTTARRFDRRAKPRAKPRAEPRERPGLPPARFPAAREFDVLLRLHPRTSILPVGSRFSVGLPPVADSQLSLHFADPQKTIDVVGARSTILRGDDNRSATVDLGKIDRLTVTWSDQTLPVRKPARLEAGVLCRVEAQPTQLQFRYRLSYHVLSGSVDFVVWALPPDAIVRAVTGAQLLSYQTTPSADDRSRLLIEFKTPQDDHFTIEATFTLPLRTPGQRIRIPPVDLTGGTAPRKITIVSNQIGVGTPAVFRLSDPKFPNEQVVPISTDSLMTAWSRSGQTASGFGKPQFAYQLSQPTEFSFAISPLRSGRTVRLHQTGRIGRKRLTWTATAEITIDPAGAPVFQHTLRVTPRLTIRSLSVKEDAAERLIRYTRRGDRVTLFLSDGSTGIQDLVLKGTMPLLLPGETKLPTLRFENADVTASDLTLLRDAAVTVDLPDTVVLKPVSRSVSSLVKEDRSIPIGRFRLSAKTGSPVIRIRRSLRSIRADLLTVVQFSKKHRRIVTTCIRYHGLRDSTAVLRLRLPKELAADYRLTGDGFDSRTEARPDGSLDVLLIPRGTSTADRTDSGKAGRRHARPPTRLRPVRQSLTAIVSSTWTVEKTGEWVLRVVEPLNVTIGNRELFLPVRGPMQPIGISAEIPSSRTLPLWIRRAAASLSSVNPQQRWALYRGHKKTWTLTDSASHQPDRKPRVLFVGTVLRPTAHGTVDGTTEILFVSAGADRLEVTRPAGLKLRALFVDGSARPLPKTDGSRLSIPIEQPFTPRQIVLDWTGSLASSDSLWSRYSAALPGPDGVPVARSVVTLIPPAEIRLMNIRGMEPIDVTTRQNERNAALQEFGRSLAASRSANPTAGQRFSADAAQPKNPSAEIGGGFVSGRVVPNADGRVSVSFRPLEQRWIVGTLAIVVVLVLIPVGMFLSRIGIGPWLREHGSLAWMLLGLVWWICLKPSAVGLVLILLGAITAVRRRQLRRSSAEPI